MSDHPKSQSSDAYIQRKLRAKTEEDATALFGQIWRDGHRQGWDDCLHEWREQEK